MFHSTITLASDSVEDTSTPPSSFIQTLKTSCSNLFDKVTQTLLKEPIKSVSTLHAKATLYTNGDLTIFYYRKIIPGTSIRSFHNVLDVSSTFHSITVLKKDGSAVVLNEKKALDQYTRKKDIKFSSEIKDQLSSGVKKIVSNNDALAAIKDDGSVVTWGLKTAGGDSSLVQDRLSSGVIDIIRSHESFIALKDDGSVVSWGEGWTGDSSMVEDKLSSGVKEVVCNGYACAAIKYDGSVVTWGDPDNGGDSSKVEDKLSSGVKKVIANTFAFTALKVDGSVVTWGDPKDGGDNSLVLDQLTDIQTIYSLSFSFIAIRKDGSIIGWGDSDWTEDLLSEKARELNPHDQSSTPGYITLGSGDPID